jgi:diguanylate cyclase (GGDEF)-like protein
MQVSPDAKLTRYRLLVELMAVLVSTHRSEDVMAALHQHIGTLFAAPVTLLALAQPGGTWQCLTLEGRDIYRKILHGQPDGLLERAMTGQLSYTNNTFEYAKANGLTLRSLDPDSSLPYTYSWMGAPLLQGGQVAGVLSIQSYEQGAFTDDDLEFLQLLSTHLGIAIENALLRERLEVEARTDALTGLLNRRSFVHSGERAVGGPQVFALAVIDVQQFKRVNDDLGHPAGDAVLVCIAQLLRRHAALGGQAFRLGGDEFALLLPLAFSAAYERLQALLKDAGHEPWPVPLPIRLNVGLAEHQPGQSFEELVREADRRMYAAKLGGVQLAPL